MSVERVPFRVTPATVAVLGVLLRGGEHYGLAICQATGHKSGTVNPLLRRLQTHGWVVARWDDSDRRGPARRYVALHPDKVAAAAALVEQRQRRELRPPFVLTQPVVRVLGHLLAGGQYSAAEIAHGTHLPPARARALLERLAGHDWVAVKDAGYPSRRTHYQLQTDHLPRARHAVADYLRRHHDSGSQ